MGPIEGQATVQETTRYIDGHPLVEAQEGYREVFGVALSSVGLGTYLGDLGAERDTGYRSAVEGAVKGGINVFDTAINYRHQLSERAIGQAIGSLVAAGTVAREALFIATKGGYLPFDAAAPDPRGHFDETYVATGLVSEANVVGGVHCIDPEYLHDQIRRSRENLGLETLDLYYVHNPETQLAVIDRDSFHERMVAAFTALEEAVDRGEIARYGIATWNGLRVATGAPEHLSLLELVRAAEEARERVGDGPHHLEAVQAPLNLSMPEAIRRATQKIDDGSVVPLALACRDMGLAFFTSASIQQGRLSKGIPQEVRAQIGIEGTDAQVALQATRSAPGVTSALVGMSSQDHVAEAVDLMARYPPSPNGVWGISAPTRAEPV